MVKLSVNETTTFRWSFEEDVAAYAAAGIPAIGVWRQKLSDCGQARGREVLDRYGLEVSHLFWAGGFTGSDGRSYRESVEDALEAVQTAAELKAKCLVVYTGSRAGHTYNHARRLVKDALGEVADRAASLGVVLAVEPMHPGCAGPWTFVTGIDDILALLSTVGTPQVKMVFDTYHLGQDPAVVGRIPELVPHIALVQLGDAKGPPAGEQSRCRLGEGTIPLREIVSALESAGYDGYLDVELLGEEFEMCDYGGLLEHAKQAVAKLTNRNA
jgi:sugar phosphate isomerase/epimerase